MEFEKLLEIVGDAPLFETGLLLAGGVKPANVRRQLSRWTAAGKLLQLRRGLYTLAPPYQKTKPHPFVIANALVRGSYVSLQAALAHYALIPEYVPVVTSVSTARPGTWETSLGHYTYRHIKVALLYGYSQVDLGSGQQAFLATPEKALLDLVYLEPGGDTVEYLEGLRLQALERLDLARLRAMAERAESPKLLRAVDVITSMARDEAEAYEIL